MGKIIAVFLDRDGTINEEVGYLDSLDKLKMIPAAYEAIRLINKSCMKAIVVTNQSGVAKGFFTEKFVRQTHEIIQAALLQKKASIDKFYYCPHHPTEGTGIYLQNCDCRKPLPGMLLQAAHDLDIELESSYMIGDRYRDMETAKIVGVKGVLVKTGYGRGVLPDVGPDVATAENKPDFVAEDILEAVKWIIKDRIK
jgi:histidinol-phosphate phosphatase family domain/HAD-superfamily hydrolase, subfamily IIIA